ncbi:DUF2934 domain-containing protein [Corallococcus praedator]|uniref:DUF2934 domain-containing protein n=1 Tax=Corallococcus praedator TaxID=2316724 RepID=A0ABX9QGP8_9BACT|nr:MULTISPECIES: DUF2934 domain-containing protein [Corallococcus]RKH08653.1 DUF2934 domain-containing protein [Corallococcus sp. CA047B]RKH27193.1 DUF2934 domain-containing protein [Corallococcus sp. CA031C]RKI06755.1 DUF2934 domain-containing protein [Corallococcus praedator]
MARQNTQKTPQPPAPKSTPERTQDKPAANASASTPTNEQIARRAFEIYQARGGTHGSSEQDWFQAERELKLGRQ